MRQILDDAATVLATQSYDPYGSPETAGNVGIFGYTGELQDGTTNAEYLRARWYQPGTGTLLGVDPELDETGQAYTYAGNDPNNASDPCGMDAGPTPTPGIGSGGPAEPSANAAPTPSTTSEAVDQTLQNVEESWTAPVDAGPWQVPGDQYKGFYVGTQVHKAIGRFYARANSLDAVYYKNETIRTILKDKDLSDAVPEVVPAVVLDNLRPDITNVSQRSMYEIETVADYMDGVVQLADYMAVFAAVGVPMEPGPIAVAGTQGLVQAPGGFAVFAAITPGIILYKKHNGDFKPGVTPALDAAGTSVPVNSEMVEKCGEYALAGDILLWAASNPEIFLALAM